MPRPSAPFRSVRTGWTRQLAANTTTSLHSPCLKVRVEIACVEPQQPTDLNERDLAACHESPHVGEVPAEVVRRLYRRQQIRALHDWSSSGN